MTTRLAIDQARVAQQFRAGGLVYVWVQRVTGGIATKGKLYAPVDTGYLRNSITSAVRSGGSTEVVGMVGASAEYAAHVHEGTRPHIIRPKGGKALRFTGHVGPNTTGRTGTQVIYARSVSHPGTKGRPFLRRAMTEELRGAL